MREVKDDEDLSSEGWRVAFKLRWDRLREGQVLEGRLGAHSGMCQF